MAIKGAAYFAWAPIATETSSGITHGVGFQLGGLNQVDRNITYAEAELAADDKVKYKPKQFASGDLAVKLSEFSLANQAAVYGQTIVDGQISKRDTDIAPIASAGYVNTILRKNASGSDETVYRVYINPKTQATEGNKSATAKGSSITLATEDFAATIYQPDYEEWEIVKEFTTLADAQGFIDTYLGIATLHVIDVQVSGEDTGKTATPRGVAMVAAAGTFVLTITGTATALYDNGVDSVASIANGKYTLTNVTAAHDIAVIFTPA